MTTKTQRIKKVVKAGVLIGILGLIYGLFSLKTGIKIPCVFHEITGLYCPGCGVTRMCLSLMKLQFYEAFRSNIGLALALPVLLPCLALWLCRYIQTGTITFTKGQNRVFCGLVVYFVLYGILRNIPAFSLLRPMV